jgi:hypothetical protein
MKPSSERCMRDGETKKLQLHSLSATTSYQRGGKKRRPESLISTFVKEKTMDALVGFCSLCV